jgi:hypothetical protein
MKLPRLVLKLSACGMQLRLAQHLRLRLWVLELKLNAGNLMQLTLRRSLLLSQLLLSVSIQSLKLSLQKNPLLQLSLRLGGHPNLLRLWLRDHPRWSLGRRGLSLLLWSMGRLSLELQLQRRLGLMLWRLVGLLLLSMLMMLGLMLVGLLISTNLSLLQGMLLLSINMNVMLSQQLLSLLLSQGFLQGMLLLSLKNLLLGLLMLSLMLSQGLLSLNMLSLLQGILLLSLHMNIMLGLLMLSRLMGQGVLSQGLLLITGLLLMSQGIHLMLNIKCRLLLNQGGLSGLCLLLSLLMCQDCNLILALCSCDSLLNLSSMLRQGVSLIMLIQRLHIKQTMRCMFALELKERVSGRLRLS